MNTFKTKNKLMATMIIMLLFASTMLAVVPMAKAALDLAPDTEGFVGDTFTVAGTADEGDTVLVLWDGVLVGSGTVDGSDAFSVDVTVPEVPGGAHTITVREIIASTLDVKDTDTFTFTVKSKIELSIDSVTGNVIVDGTGFEATKSVEIDFNGVSVILDILPLNAQSDAQGSFTVEFPLPGYLVTGLYPVDVVVGDSSATKNLAFTAAPKIELSPESGAPGTTVTVDGTDFAPGATVTIEFNDEEMDTTPAVVTVASDGTFTADFNVPNLAISAIDKVVATDDEGNTADADFDLILDPHIVLSPAKGLPGDEIEVKGYNFEAEAIVTIEFDSETMDTVPAEIEVADDGTFTATFVIPENTVRFTYVDGVVATDDSAIPNIAKATLDVNAVIVLKVDGELIADNQMPSGSTITVEGRGFTQNAPVTVIFTDSAGETFTVDTHVSVKADGTFTTDVIVPSVSVEGPCLVTAKDALGITATDDTLSVNALTTITVDPTVAIRGVTKVTVSGENFAMDFDDTKVTFVIGTRSLDNLDPVEKDGTFEYVIIIPADMPAGVYDFKAYDTRGLTATTKIEVVIEPVVIAEPNPVANGQTVHITGYAFNVYGDSYTATVTISGNGIEPLVVTGASHTDLINGNIAFLIPTIPEGDYTVTVETDDEPDSVIGTTILTVKGATTVIADPESALRATDVDITGQYFTAKAGIVVTVRIIDADGKTVFTIPQPVVTTDDGTFATVFKVPADFELGVYTVNATDAKGLTAITTLEIVKLVLVIDVEDFYYQGNSASFKIATNAPTEGSIIVTLPDGSYVTLIAKSLADGGEWRKNLKTDMWEYYEPGNVLSKGVSFQLPNDAVTTNATELPYLWEASFKDAAFTVEDDGEFDVYISHADSPGTDNNNAGGSQGPAGAQGAQGDKGDKGDKGDTGSAGSAGSAGARGANGSNGAKGEDGATGPAGPAGPAGSDAPTSVVGTSNAALVIAVVALIVGAIAAFIVITMRRKIAN